MHVHILGICGTFMAGVAAIARAAGHRVTGADQNVYPPMSDQLAAMGIDIVEGYKADQLRLRPDVVVVGNVMSRGMPVIEELLNRRLAYMSGPQWLAAEVLSRQRVIAVAGTHGKTTTASLLAWILEEAGLEPGFLIGGIPKDFRISARLGGGAVFVIEADEYDTAFFDKQAKFLHYGPEALIINNLEFDHADIYANLQAIQWQFHQLLRALPGNGQLIVKGDDENIRDLLKMGCWTPVKSYASRMDAAVDWIGSADTPGHFRLLSDGIEVGQCEWPLTGSHNAENTVAAVLAAKHFGVDTATALAAISRFKGVKRRLELLGQFNGISLYDDFAHHPTEIRRTLAGIRAASASSGNGRLLLVLEPRSNTMKMGVHRDELAGALQGADEVWVFQPPELDWNLHDALKGLSVNICTEVQIIVADVASKARPGDSVVVMSNGGFDGIHGLLKGALTNGALTGISRS
jgi:UDP-N-acetylmuramate: L-alanyl-gamma-D-glutamyl-meso-diaminopimelate ligase